MASEAEIINRVRAELGDLPEPFRETYRGTGQQDEFDLPVINVSLPSLRVFTIDPTTAAVTDLAIDTDFTLDPITGVLRLTSVLAPDMLLVVEGSAHNLFSDEELADFTHDAILQHVNGRYDTVRYRTAKGFIAYDRVPVTLDNLPEVEELPVAILATIEALWALSTDAATDIDITTSEGTHIARSQRFAQLRAQIDVLTEKYKTLCMLLNVGLYRIEIGNLRRVSRTNNRLVPIYVEREYDDHARPVRITPEIDTREADWDGPPSPAQNYGAY